MKKLFIAFVVVATLVIGSSIASAAPYTWATSITIDQVQFYDNGTNQSFIIRGLRTSNDAVVWLTGDTSDMTRVNRLLSLLLTAKSAGLEVFPCLESTTGKLIGAKLK